jgi:hypothetical protein
VYDVILSHVRVRMLERCTKDKLGMNLFCTVVHIVRGLRKGVMG